MEMNKATFTIFAILTLSTFFAEGKKDFLIRQLESKLKASLKDYPESRIVGGTGAGANEFPFQVSIQLEEDYFGADDPTWLHYCSGSIISDVWVLSSALCEVWVGETIVAGRHNINSQNNDAQIRTVVEVRTHPNFNEFTLENDIALVRVNAPFDFNAGNVARITIAEPGYVPSPGELCTISGWGITALEDYEYGDAVPELRKAEIPIVGDEVCSSRWNEIFTYNSASAICAGSEVKDSCLWDYGGPMVQQGIQVGLYSFGICGHLGYPSIYTQVEYFSTSFIRETVPDVQMGRVGAGNNVKPTAFMSIISIVALLIKGFQ